MVREIRRGSGTADARSGQALLWIIGGIVALVGVGLAIYWLAVPGENAAHQNGPPKPMTIAEPPAFPEPPPLADAAADPSPPVIEPTTNEPPTVESSPPDSGFDLESAAMSFMQNTMGLEQTLTPLHTYGDGRLRHWNFIVDLAITPDGRQIVSIGNDCRVVVWDAVTGKEVKVLKSFDPAPLDVGGDVCLSGDGRRLFIGLGKTVTVYSVPEYELLNSVTIEEGVFAGELACNENGSVLVNRTLVYGSQAWKCEPAFSLLRSYKDTGNYVAVSPDGKYFATDDDRFPILIDVASGEIKWTGDEDSGQPRFSTDGSQLADARYGDVTWYRTSDGKILSRVETGAWKPLFRTGVSMRDQIISPDLKKVAIATSAGVAIWEAVEDAKVTLLPLPSPDRPRSESYSQSRPSAFSQDGATIAAGSLLGEIRAWDVGTGRSTLKDANQDFFARQVAFSPDSKSLAILSQDGEIRFIDPATGQNIRSVRAPHRGLPTLSDDQSIFVARTESGIGVFDSTTGTLGKEMPIANSNLAFTVSRDGNRLAYLPGDPGKQRQFTVISLAPEKRWDFDIESSGDFDIGEGRLEFSPDGNQVYTNKFVFDLTTSKPASKLEFDGSFAMLAPDGAAIYTRRFNEIVACGAKGGERLYTLATNEPYSDKQSEHFACTTIRRDGNIVAAGGDQGSVRIWELASRRGADRLKANRTYKVGLRNGLIRSVALSPDGQYMATANGNGTAYLFKMPK